MVRILVSANYTEDWRRDGQVQLSRGDSTIGISTAFILDQKRVRALCKIAGLKAEQFDELSRNTAEPGSGDGETRPKKRRKPRIASPK